MGCHLPIDTSAILGSDSRILIEAFIQSEADHIRGVVMSQKFTVDPANFRIADEGHRHRGGRDMLFEKNVCDNISQPDFVDCEKVLLISDFDAIV